MGEQFVEPISVDEGPDPSAEGDDDEGEEGAKAAGRGGGQVGEVGEVVDARAFWSRYIGGYAPVVIRGGALPSQVVPWSDAFLISHCELETGLPWRALIEKNNRVVQNDRHPLMYDWTFCDFVLNYSKPEL